MYMTLLRPIILQGSETWSLRNLDELRLAIFERKVLMKTHDSVFNTKTNEWRKLHNYKLQKLFRGPKEELNC